MKCARAWMLCQQRPISAGSPLRTSRAEAGLSASPDSGRGQPDQLDRIPGGRDDLLDILAEDRAGGHHEPVGDRRRGGRTAVDRAVDQHLPGAEADHLLAYLAHILGCARAGDFDGALL